MNKLLLWDMDGTLLRNPRGGNLEEFLRAARSAGIEDPQPPDRIEGSTDWAIAGEIVRNSSAQIDPREVLRHLEAFTADPLWIEQTREEVPGAKETLRSLHGLVAQTYGTGNSKRRAEAKARFFEINEYLDSRIGGWGGAVRNRHEFLRKAVWASRHVYGQELRPVVVGDTPFDIRAARSIKALAVVVAQGEFSLEDLRAHQPDLLLEDLQGDRLQNWLIDN